MTMPGRDLFTAPGLRKFIFIAQSWNSALIIA
jgi:hypothetical protein